MTMARAPRIEPLAHQAQTVALVPAAGRGLRMGGSVPKQFLAIGGLPLVVHSLRVLQAAPSIDRIVLAVP
ncbi:MAG TPA: 2-C-methyl-D-erythritol 4-phosphate cytidylyltransferase, partial [Nitrospira sp.]|nr:2-C-methyl-D-erythritol 4-phosphate cytidylyltransferase [Nitrospira sp.]